MTPLQTPAMPASTAAAGAAPRGADADACPAQPGPSCSAPLPSLRPCPHQVAGHLNALIDDTGRFYKPLQAGARGVRERAFYKRIEHERRTSPSFAARHAPFLAALPRFHGVVEEAAGAGESEAGGPSTTSTPCLVLEDAAAPFTCPCIADLKVGARTWYPGASAADTVKWRAKDAATTQARLGWKVCGLRAWVEKGEGGGRAWWRLTKAECKALSPEGAAAALVAFAGGQAEGVYGGPSGAAAQARAVAAWAEGQSDFALHSASVLLLFEGDPASAASSGLRPSLRVVDFAHSFVTCGDEEDAHHPATPHPSLVGRVDENFAAGLAALAEAFEAAARER